VQVCAVAEIAPGTLRGVQVGEKQLVIGNVDGELFACDAICPHRGANLSQGRLDGGALVCPWHEWAFDACTGEGITNPLSKVGTYKLRVQDGLVFVTTIVD